MTNIVTPLIGASTVQVWKPPVGVTPGAAGDPTAPFALGTMAQSVGTGTNMRLAQFARVTATIAIGATMGITNGVGVAAAGGNTWTNQTGVQLIAGDYAFLQVAEVLTP